MRLGGVELVLTGFKRLDTHVVELGQEVVLVVVSELLEETVRVGVGNLLAGGERHALGRGAVTHGIYLVDTSLVNLLLQAAHVARLLRFASLLEGVTARGSIGKAGGFSKVHPVVGRADLGQKSLSAPRVNEATANADSTELSGGQFRPFGSGIILVCA